MPENSKTATEALVIAWMRHTGRIHIRTKDVEEWCFRHWAGMGVRRQPSTWLRAFYRAIEWLDYDSVKYVLLKHQGYSIQVSEYRLTRRVRAKDVQAAKAHSWNH